MLEYFVCENSKSSTNECVSIFGTLKYNEYFGVQKGAKSIFFLAAAAVPAVAVFSKNKTKLEK